MSNTSNPRWTVTRPQANGRRRVHDDDLYLWETSGPDEHGLSGWGVGPSDGHRLRELPARLSLDDAITFVDQPAAAVRALVDALDAGDGAAVRTAVDHLQAVRACVCEPPQREVIALVEAQIRAAKRLHGNGSSARASEP